MLDVSYSQAQTVTSHVRKCTRAFLQLDRVISGYEVSSVVHPTAGSLDTDVRVDIMMLFRMGDK